MTKYEMPLTGRRGVLTLATTALLAATIPWRSANAESAGGASATAPPVTMPIEQLDGALLAAMKAGDSTPFAERYRALEPVIEQVFDLDTVLAGSVGFWWSSLPPAQKAALAVAFRRYTVATYVANFDSYDGQSFEVSSAVRDVGNGEVVVQTQLMRRDNSPAVTRLRDAPGTGRMEDRGRADRRFDQPNRRATRGFPEAAGERWRAGAGGRARAQGGKPLRRRGRMRAGDAGDPGRR